MWSQNDCDVQDDYKREGKKALSALERGVHQFSTLLEALEKNNYGTGG